MVHLGFFFFSTEGNQNRSWEWNYNLHQTGEKPSRRLLPKQQEPFGCTWREWKWVPVSGAPSSERHRLAVCVVLGWIRRCGLPGPSDGPSSGALPTPSAPSSAPWLCPHWGVSGHCNSPEAAPARLNCPSPPFQFSAREPMIAVAVVVWEGSRDKALWVWRGLLYPPFPINSVILVPEFWECEVCSGMPMSQSSRNVGVSFQVDTK